MRFLLNTINERGQGMMEYGMLIIIIAVLVIAILMLIGPSTSGLYNNVLTEF